MLLGGKLKAGQIHGFKFSGAFPDSNHLINGNLLEDLGGITGRPIDFQAVKDLGCSNADRLPERIGTEASAAVHVTIDGPCARLALFLHHHPDAGADRRSIGTGSDESNGDPIVSESGVFKERVIELVPGCPSAHLHIEVLVPIVIKVGEGDSVSLLEMAESPVPGNVGKALPA